MSRLPSGQLLFTQIASWLRSAKGNRLAQSIGDFIAEEEAALARASRGTRTTLKKPRHHGAKKPLNPEDLDPRASGSELPVVYTSTNRNLAKKFGRNIVSGFAERDRYANLHKPISQGMVKRLARFYGLSPDEYRRALHDYAHAKGMLAVEIPPKPTPRYFGPDGFENPLLPTPRKGRTPAPERGPSRPTLGAALDLHGQSVRFDSPRPLGDRILERAMSARYPAEYDAYHEAAMTASRYTGDPRAVKGLLKDMGFGGAHDLDWYYAKLLDRRKLLRQTETHLFRKGQLSKYPATRENARYFDEFYDHPVDPDLFEIADLPRGSLSLTPNAENLLRARYSKRTLPTPHQLELPWPFPSPPKPKPWWVPNDIKPPPPPPAAAVKAPLEGDHTPIVWWNGKPAIDNPF